MLYDRICECSTDEAATMKIPVLPCTAFPNHDISDLATGMAGFGIVRNAFAPFQLFVKLMEYSLMHSNRTHRAFVNGEWK